MKILNTPPPIYDLLHKKFNVEWDRGLVITYFPDIHTKVGTLPPDLLVHESTHLHQQEHFEGGPQAWWDKYLEDPRFRLQEETAAYMMQVNYIKSHMVGRHNRRAHLKHIVTSFVNMYGGIVTRELAKELLKI